MKGQQYKVRDGKRIGIITITTGDMRGTQFHMIDGATLKIGREKDNDIILPVSYNYASRYHCTITFDGINGMFFVVDTSSNGLFNSRGKRLEEQSYLKEGDELWIGNKNCILQFAVQEGRMDLPVDSLVQKSGQSSGGSYDDGQYKGSNDNKPAFNNGVRNPKRKRVNPLWVIIPVLAAIVVGIGFIVNVNRSIDEITQLAFVPIGSMSEGSGPERAEDVSEDEQEKMDEKARDYEGQQGDNLLVNRADNFYYYSQLNSGEKEIYNAMMQVVNDPTNSDNVAMCRIDMDTSSEEFADTVCRVYYSILFDHPETFWLYNSMATDMVFETNNDGKVYFYLSQPYENYETEMRAFNAAADEFLSDINLNNSDEQIALDIHDKLIDLVTYDMDVMEQNTNMDYAHTAYGALVENSRGIDNYAVCDGYSLAYEYLLQQAGIDATVIIGVAGNVGGESGGHAWNAICLEGEWYEVDSTWDDAGTQDEELKDEPRSDLVDDYKEALANQDYRDRFQHFLCNVTTDEISHYVPDEDDYYDCEDGHTVCLMSESEHTRANDADFFPYSLVMQRAPVAYGTKHRIP